MGDRVKKIIVVLLLIVSIIPMKVEAKTLNDYYNELAALEKKYNQANSSKRLSQEELNKIGNEIVEINNSIEKAQNDIVKAEKDIKKSNEEIANKKKETDEMLKFLQVSNGGNAYLEYLFEADSYTDFIYRYAIVTQMSDHNNKLMDELEDLIDNLNNQKKELKEKQVTLESKRKELNDKETTIRANVNKLTEEGTTIEQDIADLKKQIKKYKDMGCSMNQDISTCMNTASGSGWNYPLAYGCVTSEYTKNREDWNPGSEHHGIDLSCVPEGTNVYAAATGTVARVVERSSCGGNMVWVYHIINGKAYTTVYMHLLSISVHEDQQVTPSTIIGRMGGGSTASYDYCTGGAHLHFGMASGHNAFGFNSYSFNPRNIFNFPPIYGGYFSR